MKLIEESKLVGLVLLCFSLVFHSGMGVNASIIISKLDAKAINQNSKEYFLIGLFNQKIYLFTTF